MSYSFRQRLKIAIAKDLKEKLGLTQDEIEWIKENIMKICPISDEYAQALAKHDPRFKGMSLDQIIDEMTDAEFEDFVREILAEARKRLKYKKKQKKKEKESESDSDSDSDSDGDSESVEQEEAQQECSQNE